MDPKAPYDPFRNYPDFELSEVPNDMPREYCKQLRILLPYVLPNVAVQDLAFASRDSSGTLVNITPVQNRPWEWTEYLGDQPTAETKGNESPVKNSTSISLDLFDMQIITDHIVQPSVKPLDPLTEANRRAFQDDFSQSVFQRDWRETRIVPDDMINDLTRKEGDEDIAALTSTTGQIRTHLQPDRHSSSRRGSPASSSRGGSVYHSGGSATSSLRHSPAQHLPSRLSASTTSEVIDVDMLDMLQSTSQGTKRKAAEGVDDDDEIEIVEGPVPNSRSSKKPKNKTVAKVKTKKKV